MVCSGWAWKENSNTNYYWFREKEKIYFWIENKSKLWISNPNFEYLVKSWFNWILNLFLNSTVVYHFWMSKKNIFLLQPHLFEVHCRIRRKISHPPIDLKVPTFLIALLNLHIADCLNPAIVDRLYLTNLEINISKISSIQKYFKVATKI